MANRRHARSPEAGLVQLRIESVLEKPHARRPLAGTEEYAASWVI